VRRVKAVSVGAELDTIQRAVEGAGLLVEVGRHGGVEGEDTGTFVSAILALAACRLRDLGRATRGTLDAELLWAQHNAAVEGTAPGEDVILHSMSEGARKKAR
jgi:hypothetical protein